MLGAAYLCFIFYSFISCSLISFFIFVKLSMSLQYAFLYLGPKSFEGIERFSKAASASERTYGEKASWNNLALCTSFSESTGSGPCQACSHVRRRSGCTKEASRENAN